MPRLTTKSRRRHHPVLLDPLEPRQHLTAAPDLAITNFFVFENDGVEPGTSAWAGVDATGPASLPADATFKVYLSSDDTLSSDDIAVFSTAVSSYDGYAVPHMFSLSFPSDIAPGQYHAIGMIDADNAVTESDETNNTLVAENVLTVHTPADASSYVPRFMSVDFDDPFNDHSFPAGSYININAYLGDFKDFYHVPVSFFASADGVAGNADDIFLGTATATRSSSGNEGNAYTDTLVDLPAGTYHLVAVADNADPYLSASTFTVTVAADATDLSITNLFVSTQNNSGAEPGASVSARVDAPAPSSLPAGATFKVYLSSDDTLSPDDIAVFSTAVSSYGGYALPRTFWLDIPSDMAPGQYHVIGKIDADNAVAESNETNNTFVVADLLTVHAPADASSYVPRFEWADLLSNNIDHSFPAGSYVTFGAALGDFNDFYHVPVSFYASADGIAGNADDILLGTATATRNTVGDYGNAYYGTVYANTLLNLPAGTYHLVAVADNADPYLSAATFTVTANPTDIALPTPITAAPDTVPPTTPVTLSANPGQTPASVTRVTRSTRASLTLQNPGKSAGTYVVRLYLSNDPTLSRNDTLFSKQSVTTTARPGKRPTLSLSYQLPPKTKLGTHYLIAVADAVTPHWSAAVRPLAASTTTATTHFHTATQIDVIDPKQAKKHSLLS